MPIFSKTQKISLFVISLFFTQVLFAISDADYLKQLEMEMDDDFSEEQETNSVDNTDSATSSADMELIVDKKELISDEAGFVKALKENYSDSYALYLELTGEQKKLIYQDFTKRKRLYNSSVKIISVYLSSH